LQAKSDLLAQKYPRKCQCETEEMILKRRRRQVDGHYGSRLAFPVRQQAPGDVETAFCDGVPQVGQKKKLATDEDFS
jgi:hypothetical protein